MEDQFKNIIRSKFDNLEATPPIGGFNAIKNSLNEKTIHKKRFKSKYMLFAFLFLGGMGIFSGGYYLGKQSSNNDFVSEENHSNSTFNQIATSDNDVEQRVFENTSSSSFVENESKLEDNNTSIEKLNKNVTFGTNSSSLFAKTTQNQSLNSNLFHSTSHHFGSMPNVLFLNSIDSKNSLNSNTNEILNNDLAMANSFNKTWIFNLVNSDETIWGEEVILPENSTKSSVVHKDDFPTNKDIEPKRFIFGVFASALSNNKTVQSKTNDNVLISRYNQINPLNNQKLGYDFGFNLNYILASNLLVGVGVDLTQIKDVVSYSEAGKITSATSEVVNNNTLKVNYAAEQIQRNVDINQIYGSLNTNVEYVFANRFSIIYGVGYTQMLISNSENSTITDNKSNIKTKIALSYNTSISENYKVQIQPTYNYYFNKNVEGAFVSRPYNFGIRLNILKK